MRIYAKALLGAKTKFKQIVERLSVARVTITKPENYSSPDSDYSVIEAQATSVSGSRYIYVYPKEEYKALFEEGTLEVRRKESTVTISQYGSSTGRFAIGSLRDIPSGTYNVYVYNTKTQKTIYEIKLIWTNNI